MTARLKWAAIGFIAAVVEIILVCAWLSHGELPEGMHLATAIICDQVGPYDYSAHLVDPDPVLTTRHRRVGDTVLIDTLWTPHRTRATQALDSADSVWNLKARREWFDRRRGKK